jgi:hypothetical protein
MPKSNSTTTNPTNPSIFPKFIIGSFVLLTVLVVALVAITQAPSFKSTQSNKNTSETLRTTPAPQTPTQSASPQIATPEAWTGKITLAPKNTSKLTQEVFGKAEVSCRSLPEGTVQFSTPNKKQLTITHPKLDWKINEATEKTENKKTFFEPVYEFAKTGSIKNQFILTKDNYQENKENLGKIISPAFFDLNINNCFESYNNTVFLNKGEQISVPGLDTAYRLVGNFKVYILGTKGDNLLIMETSLESLSKFDEVKKVCAKRNIKITENSTLSTEYFSCLWESDQTNNPKLNELIDYETQELINAFAF